MRNIIATLILLFLFGLQVAPGGWAAGDEKDGAKRTKFLNELTPDEYFTVRGQPDMRYVLLMPQGMSLIPDRGSKQYKEERELFLALPGYKEREGLLVTHIDSVKKLQEYCRPQAVFCILIPPPWSGNKNLWNIKEGDAPAPFTTFEFLEATLKDIKERRLFSPSRVLLNGENRSGQAVLDAMLAKHTPFHGTYIRIGDKSPPLFIDASSLPKARVLRGRRIAFIHEGEGTATVEVAEILRDRGGSVSMQWFKIYNHNSTYEHIADAFDFIASTEEAKR